MKKTLRTGLLLGLGLSLWLPMCAQAQRRPATMQEKMSRPSPPAQAKVTFDNGKSVTIDYSRPKIQDPETGETRKIFGELVPYGEPWRAGANEATTLVTSSELTVGGTRVPAGTYTLYTIPREGSYWTLIISKATGQWGVPYPGEGQDLARIQMNAMNARKTGSTVSQFTISLNKTGPQAATLTVAWENTEASVPIQAK
jgi:hypothetical protein